MSGHGFDTDMIILAATVASEGGDIPITAIHTWFGQSAIGGGYRMVEDSPSALSEIDALRMENERLKEDLAAMAEVAMVGRWDEDPDGYPLWETEEFAALAPHLRAMLGADGDAVYPRPRGLPYER